MGIERTLVGIPFPHLLVTVVVTLLVTVVVFSCSRWWMCRISKLGHVEREKDMTQRRES